VSDRVYRKRPCGTCGLPFQPHAPGQKACVACSRRSRLRACADCSALFKPERPRARRCPACEASARAAKESEKLARAERRAEYDRRRNELVLSGGAACARCGRNHAAELLELERAPGRQVPLDQAASILREFRVFLEGPTREDRAGEPIGLGSED